MECFRVFAAHPCRNQAHGLQAADSDSEGNSSRRTVWKRPCRHGPHRCARNRGRRWPAAGPERPLTRVGRGTGSGKTAAFLLPIVERLASHSTIVGSRALVLSPTRELAQQTMKFAASLATFTDLRVCLLVGGDAIEDQVRTAAARSHPRGGQQRPPSVVTSSPARSSRRWPATRTF